MGKVEVYYHVKASEIENIIDCGLKLSNVASREIFINERLKKCFPAYLSPEDDKNFFGKEGFKCLKLFVNISSAYIVDEFLYDAGQSSPEIMEMYIKSIVPADSYTEGMYRKPVCLVTTTLLEDEICIFDTIFKSNIKNGDTLYTDFLIKEMFNKKQMTNDDILYGYFKWLESKGKAKYTEFQEQGMAMFVRIDSDEKVFLKLPR